MILVTGSNGFIAKNLVEALGDRELLLVDTHNMDRITIHDGIKHIFHLGAISSTTEQDVAKIYKYNIDFSLWLLQCAIDWSIPVSYASSASVYGNGVGKQINPLNFYAMSKATVDLWVETNLTRFSCIRGYRFFNVYGPHEEHKGSQASPIHTFVKQAKADGVIRVFEGSSDIFRDFVFVGDVCKTMIEDQRPSGIYDLGRGMPMSFQDVAEAVAEVFPAEIQTVPFPHELRGRYQYFTCADTPQPDFTTVADYLQGLVAEAC